MRSEPVLFPGILFGIIRLMPAAGASRDGGFLSARRSAGPWGFLPLRLLRAGAVLPPLNRQVRDPPDQLVVADAVGPGGHHELAALLEVAAGIDFDHVD